MRKRVLGVFAAVVLATGVTVLEMVAGRRFSRRLAHAVTRWARFQSGRLAGFRYRLAGGTASTFLGSTSWRRATPCSCTVMSPRSGKSTPLSRRQPRSPASRRWSPTFTSASSPVRRVRPKADGKGLLYGRTNVPRDHRESDWCPSRRPRRLSSVSERPDRPARDRRAHPPRVARPAARAGPVCPRESDTKDEAWTCRGRSSGRR
jgi:hypothetical protein